MDALFMPASVALRPRLLEPHQYSGLGGVVAASASAGVLSSAMGVPATVVIQAECDDAFRGRVGSVTTLISLGIVPLTMGLMGLMGLMVGAFGLRTAFGISGAVEVLGLLCLLSRGFRSVRAPQ
ncbi:hypothetical protein [Catenulispora sp. GAS73]|uniref:hypothetical protein n=1 Tax=Catenulispora sp. GAS73 TaxID=3156269 RepID=UPI003515EB07